MTDYTTRGRFILQDTGSGANTWGVTTNQSVFQLIDDALGALISVGVSNGSVTLTTGNGSSDQARMLYLVASGVLTSAAQIVVPSVSKPYFVRNNTTGAFNLTVRAQDAGVTIPQDGRMYGIAVDGVSVGPAGSLFSNVAASVTPAGAIVVISQITTIDGGSY